MRMARQAFKRWGRIVSRLTIDEAIEILQGLKTNYSEDWIDIYARGNQYSGALVSLGRSNAVQASKRWQRLPCQFIGGPSGTQTFTATVGTYVLDCLMREIYQYGHLDVYSAVYKVLKRGNRTLCLIT